MNVAELDTPCLLLDRAVLKRNIDRMRARAHRHGVVLRPHMKTAKSLDVARLVREDEHGGITVSTLREAEYFADGGVRDLLYGVSVVPGKLDRIARLYARGARVRVVMDSLEIAAAVAQHAADRGIQFDVLIEIDTDGHRAGLAPDDPVLGQIADLLAHSPATRLLGVMTHAGESYNCDGPAAITAHAEQERRLCVRAAEILRARSIPCPVVSVGSTPTATFAEHLNGVTEMRPGNFVFHDLFQAGLGVCSLDDIAVCVLGTVIGHDRAHNRLFTDAGGLALSKDRGTSSQPVDQGYGLIRVDATEDYVVVDANQEHGVVSTRSGLPVDFDRFPIGGAVRVLPVHSCMTAAAHDRYFVVEGDGGVVDTWPRCNGW